MTFPAPQVTAHGNDKAPWRRRWIPLSLRIFGVILLVLGAHTTWRGYQQFTAIQEIERLGGSYRSVPIGPRWLWHLGGEYRRQMFDQVYRVDLVGSEADDDTLRRINCLHDVLQLHLSYTNISDAGLTHVRGMSDLRELGLDDLNVTDAGLRILNRLSKLERLDLSHTRITDTGLAQLKDLTNLESLELNSTSVTDAGLENLRGLAMLGTLKLNDTQVTNDGARSLKRSIPEVDIYRIPYDPKRDTFTGESPFDWKQKQSK